MKRMREEEEEEKKKTQALCVCSAAPSPQHQRTSIGVVYISNVCLVWCTPIAAPTQSFPIRFNSIFIGYSRDYRWHRGKAQTMHTPIGAKCTHTECTEQIYGLQFCTSHILFVACNPCDAYWTHGATKCPIANRILIFFLCSFALTLSLSKMAHS